jgi:putative ABC transport system permease protein
LTAVTQASLLAHEPAITRFHLEDPMPIPFAAIGIDRASAALSLPVRAGSLAALRAVAGQADSRVVPASRWSAAVSDQQNEQNQVGLELLLGIAIAYSAIGIASTSLMSTSGRRGELALLRLTGATRRQIAWFVAAESLALTVAAVAASAVISVLVLGGLWVDFARAAGSTPVALPWLPIAMISSVSALIGVVASTLPVLGSRRPG